VIPTALRSVPFLLLLVLAACSGGGSDDVAPAQVVIAVDGQALAADPTVGVPPLPYREQIGVDSFGAKHRLTTPANEPFVFDLVSWAPSGRGTAGVSVRHVGDGGAEPAGGIESLARAGIAPAGTGMWQDGGWLAVAGDGFARLTVQGRIEREQVLAVTNHDGGMTLVVIAIGERSAINQDASSAPQHPGVQSRTVIYGSDAWSFGMPVIAVSGERKRGMRPERYEVRMQHDAQNGQVTGGGTIETGADSGNWRDHEIAALHNVLVVARNEVDGVHLRLSFDRGATFGQEVQLNVTAGSWFAQSRLVQVAMALDYSLAVVYWQADPASGAMQLRLCEAAATAVDPQGSPSWFTFAPPEVVYTMPANASPLISGIAWSAGGDLVVGFGASIWGTSVPGTWGIRTEYHCAVRRYGEGFLRTLVDSEEIVGYDPSVAVLGQGAGLRVFYAYEVRDGVRIAASDDAGVTFAIEPAFGGPGVQDPQVFAREVGNDTVVDVLYLASQPAGRELHHARWANWGSVAREDHRLTQATMAVTPAQPGRPTLYGMTGPYDFGLRTTQVNWLGFDAVRDGDELVVVYDEVTQDAAFLCLGMWSPAEGGGFASTTGTASPIFRPAVPPPLAPGMTEPMAVPDPAHMHQLVLLRLQ
jgi:hypothetical protein